MGASGTPAGGAAACLRASESLAAFRLRARIAAAAALLAAVFCAVRVGDSTALRTAAAGLAATRRETSMAGVFFAAAAGFSRAGLLTEARLVVLPETDFAFARGGARRLAPVASTGLALWVATFCIVALIFARRRSGAVIALSIVSLSSFAVAVFATYELDDGSNGRALAIVTGMNVQARVATADNANSVLALPPGSEIRVLSNRGDWIYAALPSNLRGWIPAKSAETVRL